MYGGNAQRDDGDSSQTKGLKPTKGIPKVRVGPSVMGGRKLFMTKNPGSPGKLGKSSTRAESLSKLRGKGAIP